MSLLFYLSYASADYSEDLRGFFEDLASVVRIRFRLPDAAPTGFFNTQGIAPGSEWRPDVAGALRTSQTMLALVSPAYISSQFSGKEWQLFENRRNLITVRGTAETAPVVPRAIAPVLWARCDGLMPKVISQAQWAVGDSDGVYNREDLLMVRRSANRVQGYADSLKALAEQIVRMVRTTTLPPLDDLPPFPEVDNAFKYKAIIVEGNEQVRKMLVEYLEFSNFEVTAYEAAGVVPPHFLDEENQSNPIDLFVVDLEFESGRRDSLNLVGKISSMKKTRPAVMAMSASLTSDNLIEAMKMGAEDVVPKPFEVSKIVERMKNLASIGRNRRLHPQGKSLCDSEDPSRRNRPVFLSYSGEDNGRKGVAAFLRSNIEAMGIGVYYADDNRPEDSIAGKCILKAIDDAHVYLALITEKYPSNKYCLFELVRFCTNVEPKGPRTLLPVVHGRPEKIENYEWIRPIIDERQYADLTSERFLDGLIALLGWIQNAVNVYEQRSRRGSSAPAN
jgi:CheY-like chemotaxis protein